jgi:hypothetical protein
MHCEEKARLLDLYKTAVWAHATAVEDLFVVRAEIVAPDYAVLRDRAREARENAKTTQSKLHAHRAEHGC